MPAIDKNKSQVKLLVYLPQVSGSDYSMTYYSFASKKYSKEKHIADMSRRILKNKFRNYFRIAIFYDNETKKELKRIFGLAGKENLSYDKQKSKVKLLVYVPDVSARKDVVYVRYSPLQINEKEINLIVDFMKSMLNGLYKNRFRTALFYENQPENNGRLLHKEFGIFYNN